MDPYKQKLVDWKSDGGFSPQSDLERRRFTKGEFRWLPSKKELREKGLESLLEGWTPSQPIINMDTRVIALGSCFAANFIIWLAEHGFNQSVPQSPYNALIRNGSAFENASVIAQQFRWAFGEFDPRNALWIDKNHELFEATEERRVLVRKTLEQTDVLIMTLGLSEVWFDETTGEAFWRTIPQKYYDPQRHVFKVESVADTVSALLKIHELRSRYLPNLKIVFTISPVRLKATFRPISAMTANNASKAILRAALDEFLRLNWHEVNSSYFYFPSYEMVMDVFASPFVNDNRHLYDFVPKRILDTFARCYTTYMPPKLDSGPETEKVEEGEYHELVAHLEAKSAELQQICDERLEVISQLERVAAERLTLVQELERVAAERLTKINRLNEEYGRLKNPQDKADAKQ